MDLPLVRQVLVCRINVLADEVVGQLWRG